MFPPIVVSVWEGLSGYTLFGLFPKIFCIVLHERVSNLVIPRSQRANIRYKHSHMITVCYSGKGGSVYQGDMWVKCE